MTGGTLEPEEIAQAALRKLGDVRAQEAKARRELAAALHWVAEEARQLAAGVARSTEELRSLDALLTASSRQTRDLIRHRERVLQLTKSLDAIQP